MSSSPIILHIPHSSSNIPEFEHEYSPLLAGEIEKLTDWATERIFDFEGCVKLVTPFSRLFCDVERFVEDPLEKVGMGMCYTHADNGEYLRTVTAEKKEYIRKRYYDTHHEQLKGLVDNSLRNNGTATIIDCHSFSEIPFIRETHQSHDRPDFCIGFNEQNSLVPLFRDYLESLGYSVALNFPYEGSMVPLEFLGRESECAIRSIMIEVNRKLYMDNYEVIDSSVVLLNYQLSNMMSLIQS